MKLVPFVLCLALPTPPAEANMGAALAPAVAAGTHHTCALGQAGLRCWGWNGDGQLGLGDDVDRGGRPGTQPAQLAPLRPNGDGAIYAVAAGGQHTCALLDGGRVKCWGGNEHGQLGQNDALGRDQADTRLAAVQLGADRQAIAVAVSAGRWDGHTCVILSRGQVLCWGDNSEGQLGRGDYRSVGDNRGRSVAQAPTVPLGPGHWALELALGAHHTCALLNTHRVRCWGENRGQLGLGDRIARGGDRASLAQLADVDLGGQMAVAIAAGEAHTCALLQDGGVSCWGVGDAGQLGTGDRLSRLQPRGADGSLARVRLTPGHRAVGITAGLKHSCALLDDGGVQCWGDNHGSLGTGDRQAHGAQGLAANAALPRIDLPGPAVSLSCGGDHTCAVLADGSLRCWGFNAHGQLGLGDAGQRGSAPEHMGSALPAVAL